MATLLALREDLDAELLFKVPRAREAVEETMHVGRRPIWQRARWMDVRKVQDPSRSFGAAPTAAWQAFRKAATIAAACRPIGGRCRAGLHEGESRLNLYPDGPLCRAVIPRLK